MLTIGHANVHNRRRGVRVLAAAGCDSIGVNEGNRLTGWLLGRGRFRVVVAQGQADPRSSGTPTLVARGRPALLAAALEVAGPAKPTRIAPARWATVAGYAHPRVGPVAHVNVHLHYIGKAHTRPGLDRVTEYDAAARSLVRLCRFLDAEGFATVVTGDVNVPAGVSSPGWLTAWEAFNRAGLAVRQVGRLDAVAWNPARLELAALTVLPAEKLGSDHPGLIARFRSDRRG